MKCFIVFGSTSDENVYGPLCDELSKNHEVHFEVLSAHRNPKELQKALDTLDYDVVLAGAGLAAHLPGVVASKIKKPVLGIPVDSVFGGLDSLMSVVQMPFGVPVLTCAPNRHLDFSKWAELMGRYQWQKSSPLNLVINPKVRDHEYAEKELSRTLEYAKERELTLNLCDEAVEGEWNVIMASHREMIRPIEFNGVCIHSALMEGALRKTPKAGVSMFEWIRDDGGLWVGANNTRNALATVLEWESLV